jgi:phage terminase large subunit
MIQTTTALRRISALRSRIWGVQGGQGAGKTYSILQILINHASHNENKEIYVASAELSKMRITVIKDFIKIMRSFGIFVRDNWKDGTNYTFPSGSVIRFLGLDKEDIGKGLRSDVVFLNEANKVNFETYRELTSRAKKIIIDFNPNADFWYHKEIKDREDCQHIVLTYKDNEAISKEEKKEILLYKEKGYNFDGTVKNQYWANKWQVYGLGQVGSVDGRILYWNKVPDKVFHELDVNSFYAVDWGKHDPFGIIEIKYLDGKLFLHELNYKSENEWALKLTDTEKMQIASRDEGFVTWLFQRIGISKDKLIVCDNNRPTKIIALRKAGWENTLAIQKVSGSIIDGIDILQGLDVYFTESSKNIDYEQRNYTWDKDKNGNSLEVPIDANNHTIDPARYGVLHLVKNNVIKRV